MTRVRESAFLTRAGRARGLSRALEYHPRVTGSNPRGIRVVAVTQSDPFFTGRFFESFLAGSAVDLVEIVLLRNFNESRVALVRRLAGFYSIPDLVRLGVRYARAAVDDRRGAPRSVEAVAARHGVPVRPLASINDAAYLETLAAGRSTSCSPSRRRRSSARRRWPRPASPSTSTTGGCPTTAG